MSPSVGNSCPPIIRSVVVFPQPDGLSRTTYSPRSTCRLTSSTATVPPGKTFVRLTRSSPEPAVAEGAARAAPSTCETPRSATRSLGGEEVVDCLDEVHALPRIRVPRDVLAQPVGVRAALAH